MSDESEFDAIDDTEQIVLIRIVEWTEWIPGHPDQTGALNMHNGITGFVTSASEKLIEANVMGTGKNLDWEEEVECAECDGTGQAPEEQFSQPEQTPPMTGGEPKACEVCEGAGHVTKNVHYGLYAMQATLAQNVSKNVYESLMAAQNLPIMEEFERQRTRGRDKRDDLVVVEHKKPPPPPRKKRKR